MKASLAEKVTYIIEKVASTSKEEGGGEGGQRGEEGGGIYT